MDLEPNPDIAAAGLIIQDEPKREGDGHVAT